MPSFSILLSDRTIATMLQQGVIHCIAYLSVSYSRIEPSLLNARTVKTITVVAFSILLSDRTIATGVEEDARRLVDEAFSILLSDRTIATSLRSQHNTYNTTLSVSYSRIEPSLLYNAPAVPPPAPAFSILLSDRTIATWTGDM